MQELHPIEVLEVAKQRFIILTTTLRRYIRETEAKKIKIPCSPKNHPRCALNATSMQ